MNKYQKMYDEASPELQEKLRTWSEFWEFEDGKFDVPWEDAVGFEYQYQHMDRNYYLEQCDSQEGMCCDVKGVDTLEEAIDIFISAGKYGPWLLYQFRDGKWFNAHLVRIGTAIAINWERKERD